MNHRRKLLTAGASMFLENPISLYAQASSSSSTAQESDYQEVEGPFPANYRVFGTNPASGPEEIAARNILGSAKGATPLQVAKYFESLTTTNADGQAYNAQWPVRWNPVIVGFYQSTSLPKPYVFKHGDTIAWCSAFVNWCLARSGFSTTNDALSGSFRLGKALGKATSKPQIGDIIVFKSADPAAAAVGHGHVAFYLDKTASGFKVLGGNQKNGKKYSSVNTSIFKEQSDTLIFDSVRSLASIRRTK